MDKSLIIKKIKSYLNIKTDSDFADFLGVKQPTISSWKARNTLDYELIITKCNDIDANWLLTGKGEMLKAPSDVDSKSTGPWKELATERKEIIELQKKEIARLEKELADIKSATEAVRYTKKPTVAGVATPEEKLTK